MTARLVVTGTDTGVGKTVFSAALTGALRGVYFKPVQSGLDDGADSDTVRRLTGLSDEHFLPEIYRLRMPASPHIAAEAEGVEIDIGALTPPPAERPVIVEGAGGLLVPLTRTRLFIDLLARWQAPVILCARTALGTINHSLLSIEALRSRSIPVLGIAFIGEGDERAERTIVEFGGIRRLGRLPMLAKLDRASLAAAFAENFNLDDFREAAS
jgi:dethiobiotin synthetase